MKNRFISFALLLISVLFICQTANATTITFESLAIADSNVHFIGSPYSEAGFTFTGIQSIQFGFFGTLSSNFPGSTSLFNATIGRLTELTQMAGGTFSIQSISIALLTGPGSTNVTFVGTKSDLSTITETFTVTTFGSETTFNFASGFTNLAKLDWVEDTAPFAQYDNLVLNRIPEPASILLLGLGLLKVVVSRKKLKK
jgi:PEP-CTERM motif-containing protein